MKILKYSALFIISLYLLAFLFVSIKYPETLVYVPSGGMTAAVGDVQVCEPNTYYVDFDGGSDSNDGKCTNTAWKHSPGDANAVDKPKITKFNPGDVVIFKSGVKYRGTIILDLIGDGTSDNPITFKGTGWGDGNAIIDGTELFNGNWNVCGSNCGPNGDNIYYSSIPVNSTANRANSFLETGFFSGNDFLYPAQDVNLPDQFWFDDYAQYNTVTPQNITLNSIKDSAYFNQADPNYWNGSYIMVWVSPNIVTTKKITSFNPDTDTIYFEPMHAQALYGDRNQYYSVINHMSLIDKPGEYYYDEMNNVMYLWPKKLPIDLEIGARQNGIMLYRINNIVIDGFIIEKLTAKDRVSAIAELSSGRTGITVKNNILRFNRIKSSGSGLLSFVYSCSNVDITNNSIYENQGVSGVVVGAENVTFSNNILRKNGYKGLWLMGSKNVEITNNQFSEHSGTHGTDCSIFTSQNVLFGKNIIANSGTEILSFEGNTDVIVDGNILIGQNEESGVLRLNGKVVHGYWVITDNTIYGSGNNVGLNIAASSDPNAIYIIKNNILDGFTGDFTNPLWANYSISNNIYTGLSWNQDLRNNWVLKQGELIETDLNNIFLSTASPFQGGYKFNADSVALNKGTSLVGIIPQLFIDLFPNYDFYSDKDGISRPQGLAWDIGAYEYEGEVTPPSCTESWSCSDWSACVNDSQTKTCTDTNNCGTTLNRPALTQGCTVIPPETPATTTCTNFTYSAWSTCSNKTQSRTILTSSPTNCEGGSPVLTQSCTTPRTGGGGGGGGGGSYRPPVITPATSTLSTSTKLSSTTGISICQFINLLIAIDVVPVSKALVAKAIFGCR